MSHHCGRSTAGRPRFGLPAVLCLVATPGLAHSRCLLHAVESWQTSAPTARNLVQEEAVVLSAPPPNAMVTATRCDLNGNMYLVYSDVPPAGTLDPVSGFPIRKVSVDSKSVVPYTTQPPSGYAFERRYDFNIDPRGTLYELVQAFHEPPAKNSTERPDYLIVRFKDDGTIDSTTRLREVPAASFQPMHFAPFLDGTLLVTGMTGKTGPRDQRPFTAVFDRGGGFVGEVRISGDLATEASQEGPDTLGREMPRSQAAGAPKGNTHPAQPRASVPVRMAVGLGDMVSALDGDIYLLRATAQPRLYVISAAGRVTKEIKIPVPETGLVPDEMGVAGDGELFIIFERGPAPGTGTLAPDARIALVDLASGKVMSVLDASEPERSGLLPGCATRANQWLFLGSTEDNKLEVVEFGVR